MDGDDDEDVADAGTAMMTAPSTSHFEDLDEFAALTQMENEKLTSDMLSALDISVSQESLYNLAEVAEAIKLQSPRGSSTFDPLEAQSHPPTDSERASAQDSVVSEEDILALERELEITEPKMFPGEYIRRHTHTDTHTHTYIHTYHQRVRSDARRRCLSSESIAHTCLPFSYN